jgi:hypothetical protein
MKNIDNFFKNIQIAEAYQVRQLPSLASQSPKEWVSKRKLSSSERNKANKEIQKVLKKTYFSSIPLNEIEKALNKFGLTMIAEDYKGWSGFLTGGVDKTEQVYFDLGWMDEKGLIDNTFKVVPNAMLAMTYYKMPSGKYEVIAYIT